MNFCTIFLVLYTILQIISHGQNYPKCIFQAKTEGLSTLYRGCQSTVTAVSISNFVYFYSFHGLKVGKFKISNYISYSEDNGSFWTTVSSSRPSLCLLCWSESHILVLLMLWLLLLVLLFTFFLFYCCAGQHCHHHPTHSTPSLVKASFR